MALVHCLAGYDRKTDQLRTLIQLPEPLPPAIRRIAGIPDQDPDALGAYELQPSQLRDISGIAGMAGYPSLDDDSLEFFVEPFSDEDLRSRA